MEEIIVDPCKINCQDIGEDCIKNNGNKLMDGYP